MFEKNAHVYCGAIHVCGAGGVQARVQPGALRGVRAGVERGAAPCAARIRKAYEVEVQDETPIVGMAGDEAEEEAFLGGLGLLWCRHDCGDYLLRRKKCRFHGER